MKVLQRNLQTQFQLPKKKNSGRMLKIRKENHNKEFWIKFCMGKFMLEGQ